MRHLLRNASVQLVAVVAIVLAMQPAHAQKWCTADEPCKYGEFLGCYVDNGTERDLSGEIVDMEAAEMRSDSCARYCHSLGYPFYSFQYGKFCFCGHSYGRYERRDRSECNTPCYDDPVVPCGGYWRNQVYSTGIASQLDKEVFDPVSFDPSICAKLSEWGGGTCLDFQPYLMCIVYQQQNRILSTEEFHVLMAEFQTDNWCY